MRTNGGESLYGIILCEQTTESEWKVPDTENILARSWSVKKIKPDEFRLMTILIHLFNKIL